MRSLKNYEKGSVSLLTCSQLLPLVVELPVIVDGGLLVLLVLGDQVVHVGLRLGELHFVHALTSVPVEESLRIQKMNVAPRNTNNPKPHLSPEHGSELLGDPLEELLDGGGVTDEGRRHLETSRRDVTHGSLDVVGDPLHEVGRILVLKR